MAYRFQRNNNEAEYCGEDILRSCFDYCEPAVKARLNKFISSKQKSVTFNIGGDRIVISKVKHFTNRCTMEGCDKSRRGRSVFCKSHYDRERHKGEDRLNY